jgi:dienelactone hydrolase
MRSKFETQMNAAGVDWQMLLFGGVRHAFTMQNAANFGNPDIAYNKSADERSWRAMLDFFGETIDRA